MIEKKLADVWRTYRKMVIPEIHPDDPGYRVAEMAFYGGMTALAGWMDIYAAEESPVNEANYMAMREELDQYRVNMEVEVLRRLG